MNAFKLDQVPELSVVIPLFNEQDNLEPLLEELGGVLRSQERSYEILLIDDGSTDGSLEVLKRLAQSDERVRVIRHPRNLGQSAALVSGFERVRADTVVTLDADLQNDPHDIPRLLAELDTADVVCGVRTNRQDTSIRRLSSLIANSVRNWVTRDAIRDVGCSMRACRTGFLHNLPAFNGMHRFLPTLLKLGGARVKEIEVSHRTRHRGTSKYGIRNRLWRGIADLFGVRWLQRRWLDRREVVEVTDELRRESDR